MTCPSCHSTQHAIRDSRYRSGIERRFVTGAKWRQRFCSQCGHRWSTIEIGFEELKTILTELDEAHEAAAHARETARLAIHDKERTVNAVRAEFKQHQERMSKWL